MKPRNREVNIFNMSVLDLLTGALGAFCFLTLALFPSYYKSQQASAAGGEAATPEAGFKGRAGTVPPFGMLAIGSYTDDNVPYLCANLSAPEVSSATGGSNLTWFPEDASAGTREGAVVPAPGMSGSYFLFAYQPGGYHITMHASTSRTPCIVNMVLHNPNNSWRKTYQLTGSSGVVEFDFNILSTDINSNLWNGG
jgi:hypothetical protein